MNQTKRTKLNKLKRIDCFRHLSTALILLLLLTNAAIAQSLGQEQAEEKLELEDMKNEMKNVNSTIGKALNQLDDLSKAASAQNANEIHLIAKEARLEIAPGHYANCLTYNGKLPGPTIRVSEGEPLRVVLHNQLKEPTSLIFQGLLLPQSVSGLPHKQAGLVGPGQVYAYQFVPKQVGTFWYHPQVNQSQQKALGMYGALIVEPRSGRKTYDRDFVMLLGRVNTAAFASGAGTLPNAKPYYVINGLTGASISPLELRRGERVHMRLINASEVLIPVSLSGHKLEVTAVNGSDALEPHVFRDTIALNPADRIDVEFTADNPGVWSFAAECAEQTSNQGQFPGGIACVVRYLDTAAGSDAGRRQPASE